MKNLVKDLWWIFKEDLICADLILGIVGVLVVVSCFV